MTCFQDAGTVYRWYNEAENARDHDAMVSLLADDIEIIVNGEPALSSPDEDRAAMSALFEAYPDYRREILAVMEAGDTAAIRWRMRGKPADSYRDRLRPLELEGCSVVEVADGQIKRAWLYAADGPTRAILGLVEEQPGSADRR